ncbi:(R)-mandelonitrile lyase [Arthrobacter sp. FW306-2-2C-D06B]|uniref:(R)-mandelonitrile lyase n=1 Tax=Arthrobacter sp. FW306-2-2C-D06B TaxID=2879618 RepID=UPI001F2A22B6|nr:cupin domain-containing protein [Arthrobacter sp. FW306-2-2C-D06B]UKA60434.1 cupin domain-containing protein [Arthrobacter sp. FW306-2-2C-D06B]
MEIELRKPTAKGPSEKFTGDVYIDAIISRKPEPSRFYGSRVRFTPGARTAWHSHKVGQTLLVEDGIGLVQSRGGKIYEIHPGEIVYCPPNEEHWHGATPDNFMTHLALVEGVEDNTETVWLDHVTDVEYNAR